jgi:stage III sporulation protein SpoIIIAA
MLCGLFCALRVLTYGPVHKLMAKDTEGEQKMDEYYQVVQTLPQWLARPLGQLSSEDAETVHELRLRLGCAPQFTVRGCSCTPTQLAPELNALQTMQLTPLQMEEILFTLCGGSVHTHQTEIAQGYVTLENGCRAGLGGRFLQNPEQGTVLQELTSVNLRIAREKTVPLPQELTAALRGHFIGMLLVGEPGSGKTTLLRSIARELVRQRQLVGNTSVNAEKIGVVRELRQFIGLQSHVLRMQVSGRRHADDGNAQSRWMFLPGSPRDKQCRWHCAAFRHR